MVSVLKKINKLLDETQKKKIVILFIIMLIGTFLEVMSVSIMVPIVTVITSPDAINTNKFAAVFCRILNIDTTRGFAIASLVSVMLVFIIKDTFSVFQNYAQTRFVCNNRLVMQKKILNSVLSRPYEYFLGIKTGEVNQMVINDPNSAYNLLATVLSMVTETIVSLALAVTVLIIEPVMSLLVMLVLLLCMIVIVRVARPVIRESGVTYRKSNSAATHMIMQTVQGIKEIKISEKEKYFEKRYEEIANRQIKAEKTFKTINGLPRGLIEMVSVCGALLSILILLINGKTITDLAASLTAFAVAAIRLLPSVNKVTSSINDISYSRASLDKLFENLVAMDILKSDKESENGKISTEGIKTEGNVVALEDIVFSYPGSDKMILDHAGLTIKKGQSVGIIGTSGGGKTTSIDVLLGLLAPQSGRVTIDGNDIRDDYSGFLSHIGYIPQSIFMLDGTVRDNVAFGVFPDKVDDERVWKALREAQLEDFVKGMPEGLDSMVGERGINISGGQKQRLGIARALYENCDILVFDEATSSLDTETENAIMSSINAFRGNKTMIIIAHRLQTISECDVVYRVENGKITKTDSQEYRREK